MSVLQARPGISSGPSNFVDSQLLISSLPMPPYFLISNCPRGSRSSQFPNCNQSLTWLNLATFLLIQVSLNYLLLVFILINGSNSSKSRCYHFSAELKIKKTPEVRRGHKGHVFQHSLLFASPYSNACIFSTIFLSSKNLDIALKPPVMGNSLLLTTVLFIFRHVLI